MGSGARTNRTEGRWPRTLGELNVALSHLGVGTIDKKKLETILETEPRERLVRAITLAKTDNRALAYLNRLLGTNAQPSSRTTMAPSCRRDLPASVSSTPSLSSFDLARSQSQNNAAGAASKEEQRRYLQKHVYGGKAALCFEADVSRSGLHTISIDATEASGPRQYDWVRKIRLQLTGEELLVVASVFFGYLSRCEFHNHGERKDKGFSLEDQGDKLFMRVFAKDQGTKAVPITPEDAFYVTQILLGQMVKNAPWLSAKEILLTLQWVMAVRKQGSVSVQNMSVVGHWEDS